MGLRQRQAWRKAEELALDHRRGVPALARPGLGKGLRRSDNGLGRSRRRQGRWRQGRWRRPGAGPDPITGAEHGVGGTGGGNTGDGGAGSHGPSGYWVHLY